MAIAEVYTLLKNYSEAKKYYELVIELPVISQSDKNIQTQATSLLNKL